MPCFSRSRIRVPVRPGCLCRFAVVLGGDLRLKAQISGRNSVERDSVSGEQTGHPQRVTALSGEPHSPPEPAVELIHFHLLSLRTQIFHRSDHPGDHSALILHAADLQAAAGDAQHPFSSREPDALPLIFQNPGTPLHQHLCVG